tara:strand:- start:1982 stop:2794 length:813 start_codon:yes stop_codon:yes gene_type:complete
MAIQDEKLSLASLTGGEVEGAGAFEELMRTVNSHINKQFDEGRLTTENVASVYLGALQSTMSEAANFIVAIQESNQRVKLIDEQIANAKIEVQLSQKQLELADKQLDLLDKQISKADKDTELIAAQVLVQTKQLEVMDEQIDKLQAEGEMINQQTQNALSQNTQIITQTSKIDSEKSILDQRLKTEEAQTKDTIDGSPVGGVLGKQITLYQNQSEGYLRDAEQKAAKIYNDTFLTTMSTDADQFNRADAGVDDTEMAKVMSKLRQGISAS